MDIPSCKKIIIIILIVTIPPSLKAQNKGIQFEYSFDWELIKQKAKFEKKYIFIDCNASWCKPCKEMERNIFRLDTIGSIMNEKFISVKVQMDTSVNDNEEIKNRYAEASKIKQKYKIIALPTFLFFSPEGDLIHRASGARDVKSFALLLEDALDSNKQFYTLFDKYQKGQLPVSKMNYLAITAKLLGDEDMAKLIANAYLKKIDDELIYSKDNIAFIKQFTQSSREKGFKIFLKNSDKINDIMGQCDYAQRFIEYIIGKEEVDPKMVSASKLGNTPNWNKLASVISKKYNILFAKRAVVQAKIRWYGYLNDWPNYTKNISIKMNMNEVNCINGFTINNDAWEIFEKSTDLGHLEIAIYWMKQYFNIKDNESQNDAAGMDTLANLLYKIGKKEEAIKLEQRAIEIYPLELDFQKALQKMQKNEPTWSGK
jgi:thioredoxin-related protein